MTLCRSGGRSALIKHCELGSEQDQMGSKPAWPATRIVVPISTLDNVVGPTRHVKYMKRVLKKALLDLHPDKNARDTTRAFQLVQRALESI